ncbi:MAG TPA: PAS domain-containing protein [Coleofasciculaceae cyanobacterium]
MNSTATPIDSPLILVVDDDKFMRIQLRRAMEQAGYRVAEANDGEEALAVYAELHPDIVLLDAMMPGIDGFTCCTQLQTLPGGDRTPVLMITALEDQESVDQAFEAGAIDYITKPIHWAVLRQRVRRILQASRTLEELRQQTERAQLSEEQLRLALDAAKMGTWDWEIQSGTVMPSAATESIYGFDPGCFEGTFKSFLSRLHPEDHESVTEALRRTMEEGADYNSEFRVIWSDGSVHWVVSKGQVYYDNIGKPRRMTGINMDMTERKQAEEALRKSEARLRLALEAAHTGIWDWNILSNTVDWSDNIEQLFSLPTGSLGKTYKAFLDCVHPEDREVVAQSVKRALEEGADHDIEFRIVWPDGSVRWMAGHSKVFYDKTGKAVRMLGTILDITDRKRSQEELQRQNLRSQLFAEVTLKIRQSLQLKEILQTTVTEVQRIFQTDRVLIFQFWSNGLGKIVTEAVNPEWPSVLGRKIVDDYFESEYLRRYKLGRIYTIDDIEKAEVPSCLIDFMQEFDVKAKLAVPIFLKEKLWGLLIAHQCASTRHWSSFETELLAQLANQIGIALAQAQMLEQETHQRQELARSNSELEKFAHVASHDLQEPLRKIQTFGDRLKVKCDDALTDQGRDYVERMQNAANRMQILINDLLTLSRVTTKAQPFVPVDLAQIVQEVLSDLEVRIEQTKAQVEVGLLPTIDADPLQMRQLLQNLIGNALKFYPTGDFPRVNIYSQLLKGEEQTPAENSATLCQIIVKDSGIGFDEKYLDRIFNVFQRLHTRSEYEGTGMGLAICRKIAERHSGSITAESTLGQGATFIVTLPIKHYQGEDSES